MLMLAGFIQHVAAQRSDCKAMIVAEYYSQLDWKERSKRAHDNPSDVVSHEHGHIVG